MRCLLFTPGIRGAFLLVAGMLFPVDAGAQDIPAAGSPVRVVAVGSAPFVVLPEGAGAPPRGLSIDVWTALAEAVGRETEFSSVDEIASALDRVASGEADVAVGPISITAERAAQVRFLQPYFHASLGILAPASGSLLDRFSPFLSRTFAVGVVALVAILTLVGTLFWLAERRVNPEHFPVEGLGGIGNGLWMALVTMTTVGYGDRVPVSPLGRVLAGAWMLLSLVIASSLTAFMATALTLSQMDGAAIERAEELRGRRVGVVAGTTSGDFAESYGARPVAAADIGQAIDALVGGATEAVVFDRPMLRYALGESPELPLLLSQASYRPQNYGFAVGRESDLAEVLEIALLGLQESGERLAIEVSGLGTAR
jgi:polar amino acid transport system substrate-binding protein